MSSHLPGIGTKSQSIIQFIADRDGARYGEIVRFICEMNGLDYDEKVLRNVYDYRNRTTSKKLVRRHAGYYGTTLTDRRYGLLTRFCMKDPDGKWRVKPYIKKQMAENVVKSGFAIVRSALESDFKSDEIPNNSKVVERTILCAPSFNSAESPAFAFATLKAEADAIKVLKDVRAKREEAKAAYDAASRALFKAEKDVKDAENAVRTVLGL